MRFKKIALSLLVAVTAGMAGSGFALDQVPQQETPRQEQSAADPAAKAIAQNLIEESLRLSHAAEIFDAFRRTIREVFIPMIRGLVQGDYPGAIEPDTATASALAKVLTFLDYVRKAGDELDATLSANRSALISDLASQMAKDADASALGDARRVFDLPATHKTMDAVYAASKLITGFSYDDSRIFSEFAVWARNLNLDLSRIMPGNQDGTAPVPSGTKIRKAQAFVNDFMRMSHLEEVATDVETFARDVYAETVPASPGERDNLRRGIDQYQFMYNLQKAVVIGIAPSVIAASLSDEQLETLTGYLHSPAFGKAFDLFRNAVKSTTAYTKDDVLEAQKALKDLDEKSKLKTPGEREKAKAAWTALINQWTDTLKNRMSPETLKGLEQSLDDLQLRDAPM